MKLNNSIFSLQKRLLAVVLLVTFIFLGIFVRLFYIQIIDSKWLQVKALDQWLRDLPVNASRGIIYDTNNNQLATNFSTYDVYVRPSMVENVSLVSSTLCNILKLEYNDVLKKCSNKALSEVKIKMQILDTDAKKIINENLKGVILCENSKRYYPYNSMLTQVLGFTTIDNIGQSGLESYYNKYLTGVPGYIVSESDVRGVKIDNTITHYIPSISGCNLNLTIDSNIQLYTENALKKLMEEQKPTSASIICMDVKTGELLSMATMPNFDLNNVPRNNVQELLQNVKNVNIVDVYEPGSTFKVLTMANAIDTNVAKLTDIFVDPGYRMVDGEKIKCWKSKGHGVQSLSKGLCNSCNSVFVDLALRLKKDGMYEMFEKFNLGSPLGVDFAGESGGILMDKESARNVDIARMGFGQAVAVTPLQEITAICSVLNNGKLMQPYFVKSINDCLGNKIYEKSPKILRQTISPETSKIMRQMFLDVVKQFSGFNAYIPGYKVGGKTGTTQKYKNGKISGEYIASFIGALPADDPKYAILVLADEPKGDSYYGSIVATPYAKLIFNDIITYKNLQPDNLEEDLEYVKRDIIVPDMNNMTLNEAIDMLEKLKLQYEIDGEGEIVNYTYPSKDTMLCKNSIVLLKTL